MADESKLYSKDGFPDRLFTDTQYANLGEGGDGWKRKHKPVTPPEVAKKPDAGAKPAQVAATKPVTTSVKEAAATDIPGQTAQTPANDGDQSGTQTAQADGADGNGSDAQATGSLPQPAHEKVTKPKK